MLIIAGVQFTDLNSGMFTHRITRERTIELGARSASVGAAMFAPLELPTALDALGPLVTSLAGGTTTRAAAAFSRPVPASDVEALSQANLWEEMAAFVRPGDIVLADQGTSFYGMATHRLPAGVTFVGQPLWASIGYTLPAMLGACTARPGSRGVLLIGDGAAQMTVQELATLIRLRFPPSSSSSTTTATPSSAPSTDPTRPTTTSRPGTGRRSRPCSAAAGTRRPSGC